MSYKAYFIGGPFDLTIRALKDTPTENLFFYKAIDRLSVLSIHCSSVNLTYTKMRYVKLSKTSNEDNVFIYEFAGEE